MLIKRFYKPEYFYQPSRLFHRINYSLFPPAAEMQPIKLSWGSSLIANPKQTIGFSLYTFGLYDLALSEMILRLVRPGDLVIDVGANVGYTTRLMLDCLQGHGRLLSYEPLGELFSILKKNISMKGEAVAEPYNLALSDKAGEATITLPTSFDGNDGVASMEAGTEGRKITIQTTTLDALKLPTKVRLMKMDVEGHELSVLKGGEKSLDADLFEYIIYEDLAGAHGPTSKYLEAKGFKIYKLIKEFKGLVLRDPDFHHNYSYEPDNFLATKDSQIESKINGHQQWQIFNWTSV